jgi:hypothetical protein
LLTVTVGKAKVAVGVTVNVAVIVGVSVKVGVSVLVGVKLNVGTGVAVHEAAVAVMDVAVCVACCSGDGAQAVAKDKTSAINFNRIHFS